jgi:hypothetical protein
MTSKACSVILANCGLMLTLPASAAAPCFFDAAPERLPKNVVPLDYTIDIVPDNKTQTTTGSESVTLLCRSATSSVILMRPWVPCNWMASLSRLLYQTTRSN